MSNVQTIHPFPARMAPEIALQHLSDLRTGSIVLDPMVGSGTSLRVAAECGLRGIGFDMDPLAVLMAKVWVTPVDTCQLRDSAAEVVSIASRLAPSECLLPWIDSDEETSQYIDYWFGSQQMTDLRRLAFMLSSMSGPVADALRIAFSRIIITKDRGASFARDASHSRPHKYYMDNDYSVMSGFISSVGTLCRRLEQSPPPGNVTIELGDARCLNDVNDRSVDAIITSPPYLNAIDYLRGHRLALVWLGHRISTLRTIRKESIGNERMASAHDDLDLAAGLCFDATLSKALPHRETRMVFRYVLDMLAVLRELHRVIRQQGTVLLVVGNSSIRGSFVQNDVTLVRAAKAVGFRLMDKRERELPKMHRYLPPPKASSSSMLERRMATETVLTFISE